MDHRQTLSGHDGFEIKSLTPISPGYLFTELFGLDPLTAALILLSLRRYIIDLQTFVIICIRLCRLTASNHKNKFMHQRHKKRKMRPAYLVAALILLAPVSTWGQTSRPTVSIEAVHTTRVEGQAVQFRVSSQAETFGTRNAGDVTVH